MRFVKAAFCLSGRRWPLLCHAYLMRFGPHCIARARKLPVTLVKGLLALKCLLQREMTNTLRLLTPALQYETPFSRSNLLNAVTALPSPPVFHHMQLRAIAFLLSDSHGNTSTAKARPSPPHSNNSSMRVSLPLAGTIRDMLGQRGTPGVGEGKGADCDGRVFTESSEACLATSTPSSAPSTTPSALHVGDSGGGTSERGELDRKSNISRTALRRFSNLIGTCGAVVSLSPLPCSLAQSQARRLAGKRIAQPQQRPL